MVLARWEQIRCWAGFAMVWVLFIELNWYPGIDFLCSSSSHQKRVRGSSCAIPSQEARAGKSLAWVRVCGPQPPCSCRFGLARGQGRAGPLPVRCPEGQAGPEQDQEPCCPSSEETREVAASCPAIRPSNGSCPGSKDWASDRGVRGMDYLIWRRKLNWPKLLSFGRLIKNIMLQSLLVNILSLE